MINNTKGISINKSILHIINPNGSVHKSNNLLPNDNIAFNKFLSSHIKSALQLKCRKTVSFKSIAINLAQNNIQNLFIDDTSFIEASQKLVDSLSIISKEKGLKACDLVICEYTNEDSDINIAIILLEYTTQFYHNVDNENTQIQELITLASSNSKFKKCAIFKSFSEDDLFNGIVTDKYNSEFFISDFLSCKVYSDNREATKKFINGTLSFINKKRQDISLSTSLNDKLNFLESQCITSIAETSTLSIENFIESNFVDELVDLKEAFKNSLISEGLITDEIIIDNDVTKDYKYNKYKLDSNIEIKVPIDIMKEKEFSSLFKINNISEDPSAKKIEIKGIIEEQTVMNR